MLLISNYVASYDHLDHKDSVVLVFVVGLKKIECLLLCYVCCQPLNFSVLNFSLF